MPCLGIIFLGVMLLVSASDDSNPTVEVVLGLMAIAGGGVIFVAAEHLIRKRRNATADRQTPTLILKSRQPPGNADPVPINRSAATLA